MSEKQQHGTGRRRFLVAAGTLAGTSAVPSFASAHEDDDPHVDQFLVEGTKHVIANFEPDEVEVTTRYRSDDLARFGYTPPKFEETAVYQRSESANEPDEYPDRGTVTFQHDWTTYAATKEEWIEYNKAIVESDDEIGAEYSHEPADGENPYRVWQYREEDDWVYHTTSPINVVFDLSDDWRDIRHVYDVIDDAGWYDISSTFVQEYTRYAWNRTDWDFETQHESQADKRYGVTGRNHVRFWEFEDYVSMQAHEDSDVFWSGHEVESYDSTRSEIHDVFDDAGWSTTWYGHWLDNGKDPDHSGWGSTITS